MSLCYKVTFAKILLYETEVIELPAITFYTNFKFL